MSASLRCIAEYDGESKHKGLQRASEAVPHGQELLACGMLQQLAMSQEQVTDLQTSVQNVQQGERAKQHPFYNPPPPPPLLFPPLPAA